MIRVGRVGRVRRVSGGTLTKTYLIQRDPRETRRKKDKCIKNPKTLLSKNKHPELCVDFRLTMSLRGSSY